MFEQRLRGWLSVELRPAPCVVILDYDARRGHARAALSPQARLLEDGAAHLDAAAELDAGIARAAAARARELAGFARCRPSSWDRQPGEQGAASAATRAARPAVLEPVSEWAVAEVSARLRLSRRAAEALLVEAVFLVETLPATLAALEAGTITPAHASALVDLLQPVSADKRAEVEAAALERAGSQTVDNLRARVRRLITKIDSAAALRRLVAAAKNRRVALWSDDDGMATLASTLPAPLARACYETLTAHAKACAVDEHGNPDPRTLDQRMADCHADLILRPHADRPPVQIDLTLVAPVGTLTAFGPDADAPGELDGDVVPAPLVRELAHQLGLMPRPASTPDAPAPVADVPVTEVSVDRTETVAVPGDEKLEQQIADLRTEEGRAAAELAATLAADRAEREAALQRLLAAQTLTGTALAHRPRIALVDQLSGVLLALTDTAELRAAATDGKGLGPPPETDGYEPSDPLARFVKLRDRRCRFPGCRARARCADLDHNDPYPHGATAHDNLACLCEHHHRLSHQAPGWTLRRDPDGTLVWTLPGGHTVATSPPAVGIDDAPPPRSPSDPAAHPASPSRRSADGDPAPAPPTSRSERPNGGIVRPRCGGRSA